MQIKICKCDKGYYVMRLNDKGDWVDWLCNTVWDSRERSSFDAFYRTFESAKKAAIKAKKEEEEKDIVLEI